jgi:hypothetical protein
LTSEHIPSPVTAGQPRWAISLAFALAATVVVCWPNWPGLMSYDSLFAYRESRSGIETMLWPPMHAYLFWVSDRLGAGPGGLFAFQTFLLFFGAAVSLNLLVRSTLWALAGLAAFAIGFVAVPELIGCSVVHWRDVTTASFAMGGLAAWLLAARYRAWPAVVVAALAFGVAAALRYNAVLLLVLVAPLMVWAPFLRPREAARQRAVTAGLLAAVLGLAWASTHWRLPDFKALPHANNFAGTQEFDLLGISACADKVYLPPMLTVGWPITPRQIRMAYDPRHLQIAYQPRPGVPTILESDALGQVERVWPEAVKTEFRCYLAHRTAVFVEQMGMARRDVFMPSYGGIEANPYGLKLAHPQAAAKIHAYITSRAPELWRRPFLLYLMAPVVVALLWLRRSPARLLFLALLGGAFAYPAVLFVAAPAADARYIFPSNVVCAFILAAGVAVLLAVRRAASPARRS